MPKSTRTEPPADPPVRCDRCPRLHAFVGLWRSREPDWHNAPVPTWLPPGGVDDVRLVIVGLAPGLRGANRTGRPFAGDQSGDLLFATLVRHGLARRVGSGTCDGELALHATAITNAVRCVPPQNRPVAAEIGNCRDYLAATIARFGRLSAVLTLGRIAHESTIRALGERVAGHPFAHGARTRIGMLDIVSSYHCSRYNTNTGRLTEAMLDRVVGRCSSIVGRAS